MLGMEELNALSKGMKTINGIATVSGSRIRFRAWFESVGAGLTTVVVGVVAAAVFYRPMVQKEALLRSIILLFVIGFFGHLLWEVLGVNKWLASSFKK